jgi:hypothetical protein
VAARPTDAVLAHAAAECARVEAEDVGGAAAVFDAPLEPLQRRDHVVTLELREGAGAP